MSPLIAPKGRLLIPDGLADLFRLLDIRKPRHLSGRVWHRTADCLRLVCALAGYQLVSTEEDLAKQRGDVQDLWLKMAKRDEPMWSSYSRVRLVYSQARNHMKSCRTNLTLNEYLEERLASV